MPKKADKKPEVETVESVPESKPKKSSKKKDTQSESVAESKNTTTVTESSTQDESSSSRVPRQAPTRESVEQEFDTVIASVEQEIQALRESSNKTQGTKFLRSLNKSIKTLKTHALRISKHKTSTSRRNNTNSGFLKPVQISKDLAKFTGWNASELRSRVDVTKFICEYIKKNNLQDPDDRRRIRVESDAKLSALLKYNPKDSKPLTYYSLQTYLKSHFTPVETKSETAPESQSKPEPQPPKKTKKAVH